MLTGLLAWACTAGLGVAALLAATTSYTVLKVAGAAYLAGLGFAARLALSQRA